MFQDVYSRHILVVKYVKNLSTQILDEHLVNKAYMIDVCGSYDPRAAVVPPYSVRLSTAEKKKKLLFGCVAYRMYNRGEPSSLEKSVKRNSCVTKWNEVVKNPS